MNVVAEAPRAKQGDFIRAAVRKSGRGKEVRERDRSKKQCLAFVLVLARGALLTGYDPWALIPFGNIKFSLAIA